MTDIRLAQLDRKYRKAFSIMARFDSYDYAFLLGLRCGVDCTQHEIEEINELYKTEMRREAKTFNQLVRLKNRAHELADVLWAAIKTIQDDDMRKKVKSAVFAGLDRLEARDSANKARR